jgi:hypothetical protein
MATRKELDALDVVFTRSLLAEAHKLVKQHFPAVNLKSDAWTYHFHGDHWEFHGPDKFHWHGSASNAHEARYHGWMAYLKFKGVEDVE